MVKGEEALSRRSYLKRKKASHAHTRTHTRCSRARAYMRENKLFKTIKKEGKCIHTQSKL